MSRVSMHWLPLAILGVGALFTVGPNTQRDLPLRVPLTTAVPAKLDGFQGEDIKIPADEQQVAGMSDYLMRVYSAAGVDAFSVYVGYYESQTHGKTIHSPKNCLPGAGWEAITSSTAAIPTPGGAVEVNRYLLKKNKEFALVLYWYQGRGRVESDEYAVKWDLLRDAALKRRSDEALVRVIVPVTDGEERAFEQASDIARKLIPAVYTSLPA
jgi:EpsI family protein